MVQLEALCTPYFFCLVSFVFHRIGVLVRQDAHDGGSIGTSCGLMVTQHENLYNTTNVQPLIDTTYGQKIRASKKKPLKLIFTMCAFV